jgi:hypothetical protein
MYTRRKSDQFSAVHGITQHFFILDSAKLAYIKGIVVQDFNMSHTVLSHPSCMMCPYSLGLRQHKKKCDCHQ